MVLSVSNNAGQHELCNNTQGKPKKYALLCELLFEPSISYKCLSGNFSFEAKFSILERSSPSGKGESLLKNGCMTVGYITTIINWNVILVEEGGKTYQLANRHAVTHIKAMSHGTKRSPAHLKMYKKVARNGAPMANPRAHPLRRSATNKAGVVLLKPCFSSRTKV
jgi:hypothetical protein